jgi:hypothetical protein
MPAKIIPTFYSPVGKQVLTVSSTAVGFTLPTTVQIRAVYFSVEYATATTDTLRFWVDGSTPDASNGMLLYNGDTVEILNVDAINNFKAIRVTNDMKIMITYYGGGF